MDHENKVKTVAIKKKTVNSMNHLSNGIKTTSMQSSLWQNKWDESGTDMAHKGKNQP